MGFPVRRSEDTSNSTSSTRQSNMIMASEFCLGLFCFVGGLGWGGVFVLVFLDH